MGDTDVPDNAGGMCYLITLHPNYHMANPWALFKLKEGEHESGIVYKWTSSPP